MEIEILERIDDVVALKLPVDGFEKLPLNDKLILYHLWNAGVSGDPIAYEQFYAPGLDLRDFFLDLLDHKDHIQPSVYEKIELYAQKVVVNKGNHKHDSTKKFTPTFTKEELVKAVSDARRNGFENPLPRNLERILFDENYDVMLTQKSPPEGKDILTASCNNLYHDVSMPDLEGFTEKNPLNSTLVKEHGKLVEKVWRTGNAHIPAGLYANYLKRVVHHLTEAIHVAPHAQKKSLEFLKKFFEEGDDKLFDDYNIEWITNNPMVDTILGFIEQYRDPRGSKGSFESMVYFKDEHVNHIIKTIADMSQHFENNAPWSDKYKKQWGKVPVANAIMLVTGSGDAGPICWAGVNLPNAQWLREKYGSKTIYVSNVTFASRSAYSTESFNEFIERKEDRKLMEQSFNVRGPIEVTLHEVVGHGSGKVSETLKGDPKDHLREYYSSLEEARAELCSLYHVWDDKLLETGLVKSVDEQKSSFLGYLFQFMTMHRRYAGVTEIHEDHERATALIMNYCIDKGSARFYKKDGKTYPEIVDYKMMRTHIGDLLSEVMRIKAEGDYNAGGNLINKYAVHIDTELRDEIVARARKINYPSRFVYVMPHPVLVKNSSGEITDVKLEWYDSILDQARAWRKVV